MMLLYLLRSGFDGLGLKAMSVAVHRKSTDLGMEKGPSGLQDKIH